MEFNQFWQLINRKRQTILSIMLIALLLVLAISLIRPLKYGAESRILVMQDGLRADAYTISRTNEYLGNLFAEIIYSSSFYNLVLSNDSYQVDRNYFSGSETERLKEWRKTVSARSQGDSGIIKINVYHPIPQQAKQIALAVNSTLIAQSHNYSGNENIKINIIDQPLISERPVKPNILYTIAVTILASFILALIYIYIFPEEKYNIKFFKKRKKKTITKKVEQLNEEKKFDNTDLNEYYRQLANQNKESKNKENDDLAGNINNIIK